MADTTNTTVTEDAVTETVTAAEDKKPTEGKTETVKAKDARDIEIEKLKTALSKANGEAASYKNQLREKQTEAERAEAERAEADRAKDERLAALERTVAIGDYTKQLMAIGCAADLAAQGAEALADGKMETVFECLKQFAEAVKKEAEDNALKRQPGLSAGVPPTAATTGDTEMEQFRRWAGLPPR